MVFYYKVFGKDYYWDEESGCPLGLKSFNTEQLEVDENDIHSIDDIIIAFIEALSSYDFGYVYRDDVPDLVAIFDGCGTIRLRVKTQNPNESRFICQKFYVSSTGVSLYGLITDPLDIT